MKHKRTNTTSVHIYLTKRTKFLVRVRLFNKRMDTNELPIKQFTNSSPNSNNKCSIW
ncbi:hypothetical protein Hanom_Chr14g01320111 [Helianthus anomalus]